MFTVTSMLLTVNEHTIQLERAISERSDRCNHELSEGNITTTHNNASSDCKTNEGKPS